MPEPRPSESVFTLTSGPIAALGSSAFVAGCEREGDGSVRLYLDQRSRGLFIRIDAGETADAAERAWKGSMTAHLYIVPCPPPEAIHSDAPSQEADRAA